MATKGKDPIELWPELTVAWYDEHLTQLSGQDFVPADVLWCLKRTFEDKKTPRKIKSQISELLPLFNPQTGHRRRFKESKQQSRRPGRRRPHRRHC